MDLRLRGRVAVVRGGYGRPEEAANLIVFLSSPAGSSVTGTTILAGGEFCGGLLEIGRTPDVPLGGIRYGDLVRSSTRR